MPIRLAELDDIPCLVEAARQMHALTRFNAFQFDETRIARTFREVIENGKARYLFSSP